MENKRQLIFIWMSAIFITALIIANLTGSLLFSFELPFNTPLGQTVLLSAGIIPFPITFLLTDLLNEFYGKKSAKYVTLVGFAMSILVYLLLVIGEQLPVIETSPFPREAFLEFSGLYTNMFLASLTAYLVGQFLDIHIFHIFRKWSDGKYIWLRAQGSTVVSQVFDSLIVSFIAFSGSMPADEIFLLASSNYVWKFFIVVGITPLLYLGHMIIRKALNNDSASK